MMDSRHCLSSSWPGLSRPSTSLLYDRRIEIVPIWIGSENRSNLPGAWPMLDVVLALDGVELLKIDKPLQSISFGEAIDESGAMLEHAADEVVRYADVQDAVRAIGQNVNVSTSHVGILQDVDGRDKPG